MRSPRKTVFIHLEWQFRIGLSLEAMGFGVEVDASITGACRQERAMGL